MGGPPSLDSARASYATAFEQARAVGDVDGMSTAALGLGSLQRFGDPAGRVPALLHEAYVAADGATKARLAAALARSWAYANDAARGAPFADEAVRLADDLSDPTLLADALDAQLATRWGPDDLSDRLHITSRLQDVAAHVDNVRTRLDANLWRLTTALETLDVIGVQRQLAALDVLAAETGSDVVAYFALTRRAMHAVLTGDADRASQLVEASDARAASGQIPDAYAVRHALVTAVARLRGDLATLREEAPIYEAHAIEHGIQSLLAEAGALWCEIGEVERGGGLVAQVVGPGLSSVPHDVDWMLTVTKAVEGAAAAGLVEVCREGVSLLAPYAGRVVVNAGAVTCEGVVEDYLARAADVVGDSRAGDWRSAAASAYRRLDAPWWSRRVAVPRQPAAASVATPAPVSFRPLPGRAVWSVGTAGDDKLLPDMKGLHYLRFLLQRPGVEVSALELSSVVGGAAVVVEQRSVEAGGDRRALAAYRTRLQEIDDEFDEATSWSDTARVERLQRERDALLREVGSAAGLGGRRRTTGGSVERARVAVRKAIAAALDRIEPEDPVTARLLRTTVRTGATCWYEPDPVALVTWQLD